MSLQQHLSLDAILNSQIQMASACVNGNITMSPDNFPPATYPSYGWLSPQISFRREEDDAPEPSSGSSSSSKTAPAVSFSDPPPEIQDLPVDFEFQLEDQVTMLPADELFSDGKLVPLHVTNVEPVSSCVSDFVEIRSPEAAKSCRKMETQVSTGTADLYSLSPKAPRCSSRWRVLLGLKKLYQNPTSNLKSETHKAAASSSSSSSTGSNYSNPNSKLLKHFLQRTSKSCSCNELDHSLSLPLLKDSDCESVSISSSRISLSSSSSGHDHEDLPRLSLDSEKPNPIQSTLQAPNPNPFVLNRNPNQNPPRMKLVKPRSENEDAGSMISRGVSADSPRMNSSGKIVFHSLERSTSSPGSFNGGPRFKQRGMERSYSANVRITPVLNVPLCSLRGSSSKTVSVFGFGQLFSSSPQKRDGNNKIHNHPSSVPGTRKT